MTSTDEAYRARRDTEIDKARANVTAMTRTYHTITANAPDANTAIARLVPRVLYQGWNSLESASLIALLVATVAELADVTTRETDQPATTQPATEERA
jgi:hypothetical protein